MEHTSLQPNAPVSHDQLVPCTDCGGTGELLLTDPRCIGNPDAIDPGYFEVPCDSCRGLGFLDLDEAFDRRLLSFPLGEPRR